MKFREQVDLPMTVLGPRMRHVFFQVSRGSDDAKGINFFGPIPFGAE